MRHIRPLPKRIPRPPTCAPLRVRPSLISLAVMALGLPATGWCAGATEPTLALVEVVGTTPIDGLGLPLAQMPTNAQRIQVDSRDHADLAHLLDAEVGSVSLSNGTGSPYQNDVNYRGFQATSLLGAPVGLSAYLDGVRMNEPFGSVVNWDLIPMTALKNVDLLPGSNPLYGLNTLGGALALNTRNGQDSPGTSITVLGGSFRRRALNFQSGWVDREHNSDFFIAGNLDRQDGFRQHSGSSVQQLFGKARWHDQHNQLELSTTLAGSLLNGTQALPMDMMSNPSAAYTWPDNTANHMVLVNLKGSHWLDDSHQLAGNLFYRHENSSSLNSNVQLDDGCTNAGGGLVMSGSVPKCANQAPNGTAVNSVTSPTALGLGYGRWTSNINTSLVASSTKQRTWGSSLQWSSLDDWLSRPNSFTIGASFDHSLIRYSQNTYLARLINYQTVVIPNQEYGFTANGQAPSATNLPSFNGSNVLDSVQLSSTTSNYSAYFSDALKLDERWTLSAAGSLNLSTLNLNGANNQYLNDDGGWSWTDSSSGVSYYNPAYLGGYPFSNTSASGVKSPLSAPAGAVAGPESNSLNGQHRFQRFNPSFGFNYDYQPGHSVFGSYSEAMRAPTAIELSCANPNSPCALPTGFNGDPDLKAVVARTVEIGLRGQSSPDTSWNAAVYDSRLSNDIQFIATSASLGYFANVGTTERRGLELGGRTRLGPWNLSLNYGLVDALYRSAFTTASGQNVVSGDRIPGIARQTLKLRASYRASPDLVLGGNLLVAGSQIAHGNESNQDPAGVVPGYALVNLDLRYQLDAHWQLFANLSNVFNRQYSTYGLDGTQSVYTLASEMFLTPAPPRALWVGVTYRFDPAPATR